MYDLVFRGALLLDGSGAPPRRGDLAVAQGRIAAVGEAHGAARETIDADGLALMPGIIDNHTHYDAQLTWDPWVSPSPALGVTTAVIGNCGFTIAPCRAADRELVMRNLTQVEGMSLEALRAGIRWDFETVPQYLDMLERQGAALNIAAFVGHSSVRTYVMGEAATERAASAAEIREMQAIVLAALRAGAIGFASSTSPAHNGAAGRPMPSRLAEEAEFAALVGALREHGRGLFMLTKGGQTTIEFLEELAADCGRPVVIAALLHNSTQPDGVFSDLRAIARANQRGHRLAGAVSCCPLAMDFTLHSPYTFESLESWRPALALQGKDYERRLAEPAFRAAVRAEIARPGHFRLFNGEWDKVLVVESRQRQLEGRTIAQLAAEARSDPLDAMLDLALAEDLDTVFSALLLNSDEKAVARLLADPHALVSLSDAGAHLTFFNDAGYGLHLLGYWTRERGALTLEQAAWRLTGQPAALYGIKDRGALREGHHADLLLFDPRTVARTANRRVFDLPAGASRLTCDAVGVHGVWVNGERIADRHGARATSRLPGRLLRDFAA
ncbi:MAG TPA: amidohydrolase family protein [Burkholderiales bacterium]|nr:amidohydrolase family protein [Burkholderiales bacterium]